MSEESLQNYKTQLGDANMYYEYVYYYEYPEEKGTEICLKQEWQGYLDGSVG